MKRRGMARYGGHELRFNAAESDRWLKSGKVALPKHAAGRAETENGRGRMQMGGRMQMERVCMCAFV